MLACMSSALLVPRTAGRTAPARDALRSSTLDASLDGRSPFELHSRGPSPAPKPDSLPGGLANGPPMTLPACKSLRWSFTQRNVLRMTVCFECVDCLLVLQHIMQDVAAHSGSFGLLGQLVKPFQIAK